MHNPPHPGEVLSELCLQSLGVSVTEAAAALSVPHKTVSAILNRRCRNQSGDGHPFVQHV